MVIEEWVEVRGRTVELALQVALDELNLASPEQAEVEVVQEPQKGFLGLGGRDAIIKVKPKPQKKKRRRRRRSRSKGGGEAPRQEDSRQQQGGKSKDQGRSRGRGGSSQDRRPPRTPRATTTSQASQEPTEDHMDVESQARIVAGFLEGLLEAFGLEGDVETRIDDGVIYADVTGEQTEALVGAKGSIMQAIQELTRTVVQRQSRDSARIRLDIAGYGERRRSALKIYTARLAEQVLDSGREAVLEPMNPSDRKVVHDVIAEIDGVRSYSEGEEPNRSVVVSLAPGYEPREAADEEAASAGADDADDDQAAAPEDEASSEGAAGDGDEGDFGDEGDDGDDDDDTDVDDDEADDDDDTDVDDDEADED